MTPFQAMRYRSPSTGSGWTPLALTVPATILCDHLSTITVEGGTRAQAWSDRSGNAYNMSITTGSSSRPSYTAADINGYGVIGGDGGTTGGASGQFLDVGSGTSPRDMYKNATQGWMLAVYKLAGTSATQSRAVCYAETASGGVGRLALCTDSSAGAGKPNMRVRRLDADTVAVLAGPSALNDGNYHIVLAWMNWGTREGRLYVDGNSPTTNTTLTAATGNTSNTNSARISTLSGASNVTVINGNQAVSVFGTTLPSDAEVDKLFGYYAHQLGLTGNLPGGHPYKTNPP